MSFFIQILETLVEKKIKAYLPFDSHLAVNFLEKAGNTKNSPVDL